MTPSTTHASAWARVLRPSDHRSRFRQWGAVFLVALLARGGWGLVRLARAHDPSALEFPDERQYWLMAGSLHAGEGLRDELGFRATRMPLYPAALSLLAEFEHGVPIAKAFQWLLGAVMAACAACAATELLGYRVGWAAGLIVAFDPFLIFFSSLLLTETLFSALLVVLWWTILPILQAGSTNRFLGRWVGVGLLAALCVLTKASSLGMVGSLLLFVLFCRRFDRRALIGVGLTCAVVAGALVPWGLRNQHVTGRWCWLTNRAGISLYDGVGPQADGSSRLGAIKQMPAVRGMSEVEWNQYFLAESAKAIRGDPARILRLAGRKLSRMWNPMPNVEAYQSRWFRIVSAVWMLPTLALAISGIVFLVRVRGAAAWWSVVFLLIPAAYLSLVHSFFVGSVRYRLPAMPMIEILAGFAVCVLLDRSRRRTAVVEEVSSA